jgi:hypothetical protein
MKQVIVRVSASEREYSLASWSEKLFTRLESGREEINLANPKVRDVIFLMMTYHLLYHFEANSPMSIKKKEMNA